MNSIFAARAKGVLFKISSQKSYVQLQNNLKKKKLEFI